MAYKVKFVDVPKHYGGMRQEILDAVDAVLSRGDVILRKDVLEFEFAITTMVGFQMGGARNRWARL